MWPVILWWVLVEGLGLLVFPLTFALFGRAGAHGYTFAKILAVVLLTYLSWLGSFVIAASTAITSTIVLLLLLGVAAAWMQRQALGEWLGGEGWRTMVRLDLLWTLGFLFFVWQRSLAPDINGAEKFMDFAFFNGLAQGDAMPPPDPWMSGATINYYYFGYLMFATLARLSTLPASISYNLCVATVGGLAFAQTSGLVWSLTRRWSLGLLGGSMSALLGNLDGFLQFLEKGTVRGMDYWRASRVVDRGDTINEFPFFSSIHGDLHPHFMVLPVAIALLGVLLDERLFPSRAEDQPSELRSLLSFAVVAFLFGAMVAISPWELPVAGLVIFLLAGRWQPLTPLFSKARLQLVARMLGVVVVGYLLFLPFYLHFVAPTVTPSPEELCVGSACFKVASTSLGQFVTVFGLLLFAPALVIGSRAWQLVPGGGGEMRHLLIAGAALGVLFSALAGNAVLPLLILFLGASLFVAYREDAGADRTCDLLVAAAVAALLACELAYLKDSYGSKLYRMNTVFKLYFQAWALLAVASPWCVQRLLARQWGWPPMRQLVVGGLAMLVAASVCYPLGITLDRAGNVYRTLDGNAYLERYHADDFAAIRWLRENVDTDEVILETTGNPYSFYARFSSNTGLPTILGWANHEGLWRKGDQRVGTRRNDVQRIYKTADLPGVDSLLDQYDVRYVIVGQLEREDYPASGLEKFESLPVAFRQGQTTIYRR